jgi:putative Holliday junction resolvase
MRVLGIDLGDRRIGVAISDPEAAFAFPLDAIVSRGRKQDLEKLKQLIGEREVERVVLGLPLHMNGSSGSAAEGARSFAAALEQKAGVPVELQDERWTSQEAERALQLTQPEKRRRKSRKSGELDSMAAALILRTWLERTSGEPR